MTNTPRGSADTLTRGDIAYARRMLDMGVDQVLLTFAGGFARITRDDLPAIRRFLAHEDRTLSLSAVRFTDPSTAGEGTR